MNYIKNKNVFNLKMYCLKDNILLRIARIGIYFLNYISL